ncbi:hypothetical protein NpPPO83_00004191 [Neofusicoccum parvum]|uniref:Uncharacterized protein n=1 Tax=Neofusicoccum parvum TaxID=310453 RepID=A0ACB5S696_9PEZI|nr:hypothetical protein NpPPO83_00004191 [Neofusicoccum parvum]
MSGKNPSNNSTIGWDPIDDTDDDLFRSAPPGLTRATVSDDHTGPIPLVDVDLKLNDGTHVVINYGIIKTASTVFRDMLLPFYGGRPHLHLPNDDPKAMLAILKVLHYKWPVDALPSPAVFAEIAHLVHKYKMKESMAFAISTWLGKFIQDAWDNDFRDTAHRNLFAICLLLDSPGNFEKVSRGLIHDYGGSIEDMGDIRTPDTIRGKAQAVAALDLKRLKAADTLRKMVDEKVLRWLATRAYHSPVPGCQTPGQCIAKFTAAFKHDLHGIHAQNEHRSIASQLHYWGHGKDSTDAPREIFAERFPCWALKVGLCDFCADASDLERELIPEIGEAVLEWKLWFQDSCTGVCLDCVKRNGSDTGRRCRIDYCDSITRKSEQSEEVDGPDDSKNS